MRDLIQKIDRILKESVEEDNGLFQIGDEFGISFSEDLEIATTIVGFVEDGIVVELDEEAISIMESNGAKFVEGYLEEGLRDPADNPCWKGYKPVGTKKKNGETVPNCVPKESVAEGLGKDIKRGLQGWGSPQDKPADIVKRNKAYDVDTAKKLRATIGNPDKHSPQGLQKRVLDRKLKGVAETQDPNLAKAYRLGLEAHKAYANEPERAQAAYNKIKAKFPQYAEMWMTGWNDGERFAKESIDEAEYQGKDVPLGKKLPGDVKKYKVYVKNPKGRVVKVNFGDKKMRIKKSNPERRKSFRARHNCDNPGPRTSARYWSCRNW